MDTANGMTDAEWQKYVWEQSRRVELENRERGLPKLQWHMGQLRWVEPPPTGKPATEMQPVED